MPFVDGVATVVTSIIIIIIITTSQTHLRPNRSFPPMPTFKRHYCSTCEGAACGDRFVCWCPASFARALRVTLENQPPPATVPHMIMQIMPSWFVQQYGSMVTKAYAFRQQSGYDIFDARLNAVIQCKAYLTADLTTGPSP